MFATSGILCFPSCVRWDSTDDFFFVGVDGVAHVERLNAIRQERTNTVYDSDAATEDEGGEEGITYNNGKGKII